MQIKPQQVDKILKSTGSQIGFVRFRKLNGEMRDMWFQATIPKNILVGRPVYDAKEHELTHVRDLMIPLDDGAIRSVKWEAVYSIHVRGRKYVLRRDENANC